MSQVTILNPAVSEKVAPIPGAGRVAAVKGARIGFVDNSKIGADMFLRRLQSRLAEQGVEIGVVVRKHAPKDDLTEQNLADLARCAAVVQAYGDCGTSTSMSVADGVKLESRGVPTATVCSSAFCGAARLQAGGRGMADLPIVEIPHPMHTASRALIEERADAAVDKIVAALTRAQHAAKPAATETVQQHMALADSPDSLAEFFFEQGWTDGLPVVPPTAHAVEAMLAAGGRAKDALVGPIPPRMRTATVEKLAINAVMAGCKSDYFPVVLAALDAVLDPDMRLYGILTATNTASPLIIVNGPAVRRLGINARGNSFGQGFRANATIGRAVNLILRNVGGDMPGETNLATHGHAGKFTFCIAENEAESPWEPLHVERGLAASDSAVTVVGGSSPQNVFTYGCETGEDILEHFVGALTGLGHNNIIFPTGPLLVLSPEHAQTLARDGFGKREIRHYLFEKARVPLSRFAERTVTGLHHRRARWFELGIDREQIGVADHPEDITIVVSGGAGIHSQFVPTSFSYHPVTRKLDLDVAPAKKQAAE